MQKEKLPLFEIAAITVGEIIVSLIVCGVYLIIGGGSLHYSVITGAALGSTVTVLNFLFLAITITKAADKIMAERGDAEMDEDAAAEFAAKHQGELQNAAKLSYVVRMATMIAALVGSLIFKEHFNVIATVIPLLAFRPILTVAGLIKRRNS